MMRTRARSMAPVMAAVLTIAGGCALQTAPPWIVAGAQPVAAADPQAPRRLFGPVESWTGRVILTGAQRPAVAHAGLQLPRVSPDGQWIAYLQPIDENAAGYGPDSLIDGDGLHAVQLAVRPVAEAEPVHLVPSPGPCWPTWINQDKLLFISYDARGSCALGIYDVRTGETQRKSLGLRHLFAPAASRDGRRIAVSAWGNLPDQAVLFLADLTTLQLHPGPPPARDAGAQLLPRWIDPDTLLYVELDQDGARLMRWTVGDTAAQTVAALNAPPSVFDAHHMIGGIADPLSPDAAFYAAYLPVHNAVTLTPLDGGAVRVTRRGTRAGVWWNHQWFIGSRDDAVELIQLDPARDTPHAMTLLNGQWAPLWADAADRSLLLAGPDPDHYDRLHLMQLWLVLEDE